ARRSQPVQALGIEPGLHGGLDSHADLAYTNSSRSSFWMFADRAAREIEWRCSALAGCFGSPRPWSLRRVPRTGRLLRSLRTRGFFVFVVEGSWRSGSWDGEWLMTNDEWLMQ